MTPAIISYSVIEKLSNTLTKIIFKLHPAFNLVVNHFSGATI